MFPSKLFDFIISNTQGPYILIHTEKHSEEIEKICSVYKFAHLNYFFHIFAAHDWFRGYQFDYRIVPVTQRVLKKKFITFNRLTGNARIYRSLFVGELSQRNLIEQGYVSYSHVCPEHGHYSDNLTQAIKTYDLDVNYVDDIKQALDILPHPLRIEIGRAHV